MIKAPTQSSHQLPERTWFRNLTDNPFLLNYYCKRIIFESGAYREEHTLDDSAVYDRKGGLWDSAKSIFSKATTTLSNITGPAMDLWNMISAFPMEILNALPKICSFMAQQKTGFIPVFMDLLNALATTGPDLLLAVAQLPPSEQRLLLAKYKAQEDNLN